MAFGIFDNLIDFLRAVTQLLQRLGYALVDDLEIAAAGQFLELDKGEVGLDAGGVAIHYQTDGSGGCDYRDLRVSIAVFLPQLDSPVGGVSGSLQQVGRAFIGVDAHRLDGEILIFLGIHVVGGAFVVPQHLPHMFAVALIGLEGSQLLRHLSAGGIGVHVNQ